MLPDVIEIWNRGEILLLGRFRTFADIFAPKDGRARVLLRRALAEPRAMAQVRALLGAHSLLPYGYVLNDFETMRIVDAALASGALEARVSAEASQYRSIGDAQAAPRAPPMQAAVVERFQPRPVTSAGPGTAPLSTSSAQAAPEPAFASPSKQAQTLKQAGKTGAPFCEICK